MHFDALTLAAIVDELSSLLVDGRVQQVIAPDEQSIGLEIYAQRERYYLLCSAHPEFSRIHLVSHKLRRGAQQHSPLLLLLRKYVRGAIVTAIDQPLRFERVARLCLEHAEHGPTVLIVEPMGRLANVVLTNPEGRVLECVRRVRANDRGSRVLLPGKPYSPPPDQEKLPPLDDGRADYYAELGAVVAVPGPLWRALVAGVAGVSPTQGRELAWRASGDINAPANQANVLAVAQALQELWSPTQTGEWQPGVWREGTIVGGFSAYEAHARGNLQRTHPSARQWKRTPLDVHRKLQAIRRVIWQMAATPMRPCATQPHGWWRMHKSGSNGNWSRWPMMNQHRAKRMPYAARQSGCWR
ncbi:MAG: hypothetical protein HC802_21035 [Caldilineaceae bacterium]|nr:hypothetical protein [Caldilineaceae bacterium]